MLTVICIKHRFTPEPPAQVSNFGPLMVSVYWFMLRTSVSSTGTVRAAIFYRITDTTWRL